MRRAWMVAGIACLALLLAHHFAAGAEQAQRAPEQVDLLFRGGTVVDGSGSAGRKADVGIRGERIVFVGDAARAGLAAAKTMDATGLIVAPGFVDTHTHTAEDLSSPERKSNVNFLMQGVTTVVTGNDGGGPVHPAPTLRHWEEQGIGTNAALLVGHGAVRREVLGNADAQPTAEQLEKMKALVRGAMEEGAFGLSTGLFYVPGSFAKTEEVIALAKVAAVLGGIYDSHLRDEDSYSVGLLGAIEEAIRIGREAKIHVNISHIKALGPLVWGQSTRAIELIRKARAEGISLTADQYPYVASGSSLTSSLLPAWAQAGPREEVLARLSDPAVRAKLLAEMAENLKRRAGPEAILFRSSDAPELRGRTLAMVAKERKQTPLEAALDIILHAYRERQGRGLAIVSFNMNEDDVVRFLQQDFVMTGSDGSRGHPRMYGTYPRKYRVYVAEKKVLTLPVFVQRSSGMPAEVFRIPERGLLRAGYFADVIAFDPAAFADRATFEHPEELAVGMKYVVVNGRLVVENGHFNGTLAGRPLRKQPRKP